MALTDKQREDFVQAFSKLTIMSWSDEEFAARLESDPRSCLAEAGIELPAGSEVVIDRHAEAVEGTPEEKMNVQVDLFEKGLESNRFEFHIPATPQVDTANLTDEELAAMAGGGGIYCCCCPCSCCT